MNSWCFIGPYLLHLAALPLACRAGDFHSDRALLPLPAQRHAVRLQRAEGDLQLRPREAARSAFLRGDLRGLQHWRAACRTLRDHTQAWALGLLHHHLREMSRGVRIRARLPVTIKGVEASWHDCGRSHKGGYQNVNPSSYKPVHMKGPNMSEWKFKHLHYKTDDTEWKAELLQAQRQQDERKSTSQQYSNKRHCCKLEDLLVSSLRQEDVAFAYSIEFTCLDVSLIDWALWPQSDRKGRDKNPKSNQYKGVLHRDRKELQLCDSVTSKGSLSHIWTEGGSNMLWKAAVKGGMKSLCMKNSTHPRTAWLERNSCGCIL